MPVTRSPRFEDVLGPLAAAIVREVAARKQASVAEVVDGLRGASGRDYAYTTVMTVIGRLRSGGWSNFSTGHQAFQSRPLVDCRSSGYQ